MPRPPVPDGTNAVQWINQSGPAIRVLAWVVSGLGSSVAVAIALLGTAQSGQNSSGAFFCVPLGLFALKLLFTWHCCERFSSMREGGMELLLTTPITDFELLQGIWRSGHRVVIRPACLLFGTQLLIVVLQSLAQGTENSWPLAFLSYAFVIGGLDLLTLANWSAWTGLRTATPVAAFAMTVGVVLAIRIPVFCVPNLLFAVILKVWGTRRLNDFMKSLHNGAEAKPLISQLHSLWSDFIHPPARSS